VAWHNLHAVLPTAPANAATFTDQNGQCVRMFTARAWTDCHINVNQQNNNCYAPELQVRACHAALNSVQCKMLVARVVCSGTVFWLRIWQDKRVAFIIFVILTCAELHINRSLHSVMSQCQIFLSFWFQTAAAVVTA
jgi:hypothetical protein